VAIFRGCTVSWPGGYRLDFSLLGALPAVDLGLVVSCVFFVVCGSVFCFFMSPAGCYFVLARGVVGTF
jgi:hypothetical protein